MESFWQTGEPVLTTVLTILVPVLCGYFLAKRQILHEAALEDLSKLLIGFLLPCMIFTSVTGGLAHLDWCNGFLVMLASPVLTTVGFGTGWLLVRVFRVEKSARRVVTACAEFSNVGYIPFGLIPALMPVVTIFGDPKEATARGLIYIAMFLFFWTPLMWSLGVGMFRDKGDDRRKWWQAISPPFVAVVVGLLVGASPLEKFLVGEHPPLGFLQQGLYLLGSTTVPLVMLVLGGTLAEISWSGHVRLRPVLVVLLARTIVMPLLVFTLICLCVQQFGRPKDLLVLFILLLEGVMPPATNLAVIARRYQCYPQLVSGILLISYLVSLITIPLWLTWFLHWLGKLP